MSAVDQLVSYILSLTPEQVEKAVSRLPQVISAIEGLQQPAPPSENEQTQ